MPHSHREQGTTNLLNSAKTYNIFLVLIRWLVVHFIATTNQSTCSHLRFENRINQSIDRINVCIVCVNQWFNLAPRGAIN